MPQSQTASAHTSYNYEDPSATGGMGFPPVGYNPAMYPSMSNQAQPGFYVPPATLPPGDQISGRPSGLSFTIPENNDGGNKDPETQSVNSMDDFEARLNALKKLWLLTILIINIKLLD